MPATNSETPLVVLTTVGSEEEAERIARGLVERRVAACVNVVPGVRSFYTWQGEICADAEFLLVSKTTDTRYPDLACAIRELHSYDVPEIVALPTHAVDEDYARWLGNAVRNDAQTQR